MRLESYRFSRANGFNKEPMPDLDSDSTMVLIFGASKFNDDDKVFTQLRKMFPKSIFVGCSTAGEIFGKQVFDNSLAIAITRFSQTQLKLETSPISNMAESFAIGQKLAKNLNRNNLNGVFILSDGLRVNGSELVRGFSEELPSRVVVTGGLAGDGSDFKQTWIIKDSLPVSGYVSAVGFYGDKVRMGHGSQGGWDFFGPERIVTKAVGSILYELDGKPALALYKEYLGEKASELPASALLFPLQIRSSESADRRIVRTVLAVDESDQSMTFAGNIPQGSLAQLMRANFERLIEGASSAAESIRSEDTGKAQLAIAISCVGRRLVLGERVDEEVEATLESLPPQTLQVGFYSYGEISPFVKGQSCELHNQTMTLTTIAEVD